MKIFLSWSGTQSRKWAELFREWIPNVIQAVDPWMSTKDIRAGQDWSTEVRSKLEETRFGILFITQANRYAPWLLFEAGALAKTLKDTYVCPYLLRVKPSDLPEGPLRLFQTMGADKKGTHSLVYSINKAIKDGAIKEDRLEKAFDMWWSEYEKEIDNLLANKSESEDIDSQRAVPDINGKWEYKCTVADKDNTMYGGDCKIEMRLTKQEVEVEIIGQRKWEGEKSELKSDLNWKSTWGIITSDHVLRFQFEILGEEAEIDGKKERVNIIGYAYGDLASDEKGEMKILGKFFNFMPPSMGSMGDIELKKMKHE